VDEAFEMSSRRPNLVHIALGVLLLLSLGGCCGQFFRGKDDVVAVSISPSNVTIVPGGTQQFTATGTFGEGGGTGDVTAKTAWRSSDPAIATINSAGLATGVALGTVTISGDCDCYVQKTNLIVSNQAMTLVSIVVTPANPAIGVGQTQQFTATGHYTDGSTTVITSSVTWTSSDTTIATINSSGVATAAAAGVTTITATSSSISNTSILTVS
jgi:trimeric autotransporter adhesin